MLMMSRGLELWSTGMATQIVMDHTGDTRHYFNTDDAEALFNAEERFELLTSLGFTAAVRDASGRVLTVSRFRSIQRPSKHCSFRRSLVGG